MVDFDKERERVRERVNKPCSLKKPCHIVLKTRPRKPYVEQQE